VAWTSGGGKQEGVVDFIHADPDGKRWAFISLPGGSWAAVDVKFLTKVVNL
jgi:hypothetical protein